jgi:hypothetical protein
MDLTLFLKKHKEIISVDDLLLGKDELTDFAYSFFKNRPFFYTPQNSVSIVEKVKGVVLYRDNNKQVQLFIVEPNCIIPQHGHPDVDSYEMLLCGMEFNINNKTILPLRLSKLTDKNNYPLGSKFLLRVRPNEIHGGKSSSNGGAFLSIQLWLNNKKPTSVGENWIGNTMGDIHTSKILN